ncbi:MAG: hypothetical protein ABN479_19750 [Billgrantia sp.]
MHQQQQIPGSNPPAILHDAGEVAVVTREGGRTLHKHALVIAFDSERELQRAIDAMGCRYQPRADLPAEALHREQAHG